VQSDFGLVQNSDVTNSNITVSNNHVSNASGDGIQATGINNAGTFNVKINDNNVSTPPDLTARYGIRVQQSNVGTQPTLNLEMHGNTTAGAWNAFQIPGVDPPSNGIGVRKQDPYQFGIEGLSPTPTNAPGPYIDSQNPAGHGTDKIAGTGFIAQNVALYRQQNDRRDYRAQSVNDFQNANVPTTGVASYRAAIANFIHHSQGSLSSVIHQLDSVITPTVYAQNDEGLSPEVASTVRVPFDAGAPGILPVGKSVTLSTSSHPPAANKSRDVRLNHVTKKAAAQDKKQLAPIAQPRMTYGQWLNEDISWIQTDQLAL
jgi:hypothetical protein